MTTKAIHKELRSLVNFAKKISSFEKVVYNEKGG
jgi:hypothetical protein